jgi:redox-sensing transcriptional repressor
MVRMGSVPSETTDRLFSYLRPLMCLLNEGTETVSSRELARVCHVNPSVIRKDFSYLGSLGTRGVGYHVGDLIGSIRRMLRFDQDIRVAVVGVGNIGKALLEQSRFEFEGFRIVMAFDSDPDVVGRRIGKVVVEDAADLEERIESDAIQLAILAVPESSAPSVARRLGAAGVRCILSFAPCELAMPDSVRVTCVDLSVAMARLVYHSYFQDECEDQPGSRT